MAEASSNFNSIFNEAVKQSVGGILLSGVEKASLSFTKGTPNYTLKLRWIGQTLQLENRNKNVTSCIRQLTDFFKHGEYRSCVLKGQGVSLLYPYPNRRRCGDIDLWVEGRRDEIVDYIRSRGVRVYDIHLVHATADFFTDVPVEIHFRPSWMYNPFLDHRLQAFFLSQSHAQFAHYDAAVGFAYPTIFFNLIHSMVHINRHIFEEGIGIRQLMDYYYILQHSSAEERAEAYQVLCYVGLRKFVGAVMYVMQQIFLLRDELFLCQLNEELGEQLLNSVLAGGNFGQALGLQYGRNKIEKGLLQCKHNWHLLRPYANEALWIPPFQVGHYLWRKCKGYL